MYSVNEEKLLGYNCTGRHILAPGWSHQMQQVNMKGKNPNGPPLWRSCVGNSVRADYSGNRTVL